MENWKNIKGFEGKYQISDDGRVKSLRRIIGNRSGYIQPERILINQFDSDGYHQVTLSTEKRRRKTVRIAKLVLSHFAQERYIEGLQVCHKDGNKINNHISNLYSGTALENNRDKYLHGTTRLTPDQVREIQCLILLKKGPTEIARLVGVKTCHVNNVKYGTSGKAIELL